MRRNITSCIQICTLPPKNSFVPKKVWLAMYHCTCLAVSSHIKLRTKHNTKLTFQSKKVKGYCTRLEHRRGSHLCLSATERQMDRPVKSVTNRRWNVRATVTFPQRHHPLAGTKLILCGDRGMWV